MRERENRERGGRDGLNLNWSFEYEFKMMVGERDRERGGVRKRERGGAREKEREIERQRQREILNSGL